MGVQCIKFFSCLHILDALDKEEKNSTVCTACDTMEGKNDWEPLYLTKETLMSEMKKAKGEAVVVLEL